MISLIKKLCFYFIRDLFSLKSRASIFIWTTMDGAIPTN